MGSEPVWRHGDLVMTWIIKDNLDFLYIGRCELGYIMRYNLYMGHEPWRSCLLVAHPEGSAWHPTREAAQSALVEAAAKALLGEGK